MSRAFAILTCLAIAGLALLSAPTQQASAHANQLRSSPSPNQELGTSPGRIIIWFTEPIEGSYSRIQVLDRTGTQVDNGDSALDPTEPTAMSVSLPDLPNGTYTVVWRNLSTVDGHRVVGSFLFSIGEPIGAGVEVDADQPILQTPADPWVRWTFFMGAMALFGSLLFELIVVGPAFSEASAGTARRRAAIAVAAVTTRLTPAALVVTATGHLVALFQQAYVTSDGGLSLGGIGSVAIESGWGRLWLWKSGALALAGLGLVAATITKARGQSPDDERHLLLTESVFGQVALVAAAAVLIITTLGSHNAAAPSDVRALAIVTDLVHIIASGAWLGGLAMLIFALPALRRTAADQFQAIISESISRFSTLAMLSAGALIITGIFSAYMQVTVPAALGTPYGWTLVAKIALILPLLGFAAYNGFRVAKRLGEDRDASSRLRRIVALEVAVAALVLLAVGWLASLEPARQYAARHGIGVGEGAAYTATDSGTRIAVNVRPAKVGTNSIRVTLTDTLGRPVTTASDVRVRIGSLVADLADPRFSLQNLGGGVWGVEDHRLNIAGPYQAEIIVNRSDAFTALAAFRFEALGDGAVTDAIQPQSDTAWSLFGIQVALLGALGIGVASPLLGARVAAPRKALLAIGGTMAFAGLLVAVNVSTVRVGFAEQLANPFPPTGESVAIGRDAYGHSCAYCHGDTGHGDGPGREELEIEPADLVIHVPLHTDSFVFEVIRDGIPSRGMPEQAGHLTDDEMWHIVNYLRVLSDAGGP